MRVWYPGTPATNDQQICHQCSAEIPVGIAVSLSVIAHEIPQEVGDFAILIHSGYSKKKAFLLLLMRLLPIILLLKESSIYIPFSLLEMILFPIIELFIDSNLILIPEPEFDIILFA